MAELATYAVLSSKGRLYPEPDDHRSAFERDRNRISSSAAFRRLEYKTQVFINHEGDYYRTRLTHSLEVAQIARSIARRLLLNEDLVEAIALAHDLGHPPFGHPGEMILDGLMKNHGGFEHNIHSYRLCAELEECSPLYRGLNLSYEVREGLVKHDDDYSLTPEVDPHIRPGFAPSLEAQLVGIADEIAYNSHDIDDGLESGHLKSEQLFEMTIWRDCWHQQTNIYGKADQETLKQRTQSAMIGLMVSDVVAATNGAIARSGVRTVADVRSLETALVQYSPAGLDLCHEAKRFLRKNLYYHPTLEETRRRADRCLEQLFSAYLACPDELPRVHSIDFTGCNLHRAVCDGVAAMTDRKALDEYRRLFMP